MLFSEVTGHNKIKDVLLCIADTDKVGHAYLFEGPSGVGKLMLAKAFAQKLVCDSLEGGDSCGVCTSCTRCESGNHPDICIVTNQLYDPSKKSTDILVDTIRKMKNDVYIKPFLGARKIYIIPKADTMNPYAQNSLLKILEEPPKYCTIILLAENKNAFLPTILSRVSLLKFFPLSEDEILKYMHQNFREAEEDKLRLAAKMCGGSISKATELLENEDINQLRDELLDHIFALLGGRRRTIYDFSLFLKQNKEDINFLMDIMQDLFRDVLYIKEAKTSKAIVNFDKQTKIQKLAENMHERSSVKLLEVLLKYSDYFSKNIGYGIISQCLGLELWEAINDRGYRSKI